MPHLDASALTQDAEGIEFLGRVLEVSVGFTIPRGAFDLQSARRSSSDRQIECEVNRPRRYDAMPEPA